MSALTQTTQIAPATNRTPTTLIHIKDAPRMPRESVLPIHRPTRWGNPFVEGRDGDREAVVGKYARWIRTQPELVQSIRAGALTGKQLVCFCAPNLCHGHVLLAMDDLVRLGDRIDRGQRVLSSLQDQARWTPTRFTRKAPTTIPQQDAHCVTRKIALAASLMSRLDAEVLQARRFLSHVSAF